MAGQAAGAKAPAPSGPVRHMAACSKPGSTLTETSQISMPPRLVQKYVPRAAVLVPNIRKANNLNDLRRAVSD